MTKKNNLSKNITKKNSINSISNLAKKNKPNKYKNNIKNQSFKKYYSNNTISSPYNIHDPYYYQIQIPQAKKKIILIKIPNMLK